MSHVNDSFEEFSGVHVSGNLVAGTPDTISETGSMKSRSRRTLPYLPPEEPAPLPTQAKKAQERMRYTYTLSKGSSRKIDVGLDNKGN